MISEQEKRKIADTTKDAFSKVIKRKGVVHIGVLVTVEVSEDKFEQVTMHLTKQGYSHLNIGAPEANGETHEESSVKA